MAILGGLLPQPVQGGSLRKTPVVEAIRRAQPSVVSISSEKKAASTSRWPFTNEESQRPRVAGMGTGVILDPRGYILTNHHVVDKVQGIEVHLVDGTSYPARVLQFDANMDLAVLKVDAGRPLTAIPIGASSDLMVGEDVITIGNAFGYENTASVGIISALKRNVTLADDQVYRNLIQTDACINPGNSGGPLINIDGELIGINVAVRAGAQGIGFALPIDDIKPIAADLLSTRRLAATWHGLIGAEAVDGQTHNVIVSDIQPGSPAEEAGFRPGDQLVRVGDVDVTTPLDIERGLLEFRPGQKAQVQIRRQGREQALALEPRPLHRVGPDANEQVLKLLGLKTMPVPPEYVVAASDRLRGGLYVQSVVPGSAADLAAIRKGDILVGMKAGDRNLETIRPDNVLYILRLPQVVNAQAVQFFIVRHNTINGGFMNLAGISSRSVAR